jgi:hypothetical protein
VWNVNIQEDNNISKLYTQRSLENLDSPDQLKDYLKVTGAPVWIMLIAVFILLAGFFAWSGFAALSSFTSAKGTVQEGVMTVILHDQAQVDVAQTTEEQAEEKAVDELICRIGDVETVLSVNGRDLKGNRIASGKVPLPDGTYDVRIGYRKAKAIELLLN